MKFSRNVASSVFFMAMMASTASAKLRLLEGNKTEVADERHVVTLWWVFFGAPENCVSSPDNDPGPKCGLVDNFGQAFVDSLVAGEPDPTVIAPNYDSKITMLHGAGGFTDPDGKLTISSTIYLSPDTDDVTVDEKSDTNPDKGALELEKGLDPMQFGNGLVNLDSEVFVVLRDHGTIDEEGWVDQISNYNEPWCNDPNMKLVSPHGKNRTCVDFQFSVWSTGEDGEKPMLWFSDGTPISGTKAYLYRRGDALQAVVDTHIFRNDDSAY